tara:strand:- start:825 stop:962 length:138 start_codon:yes stop_codon:yes gene_type:complete
MNQAQNNTKGIIFILIGMASFSIQDSLIKFILMTLHYMNYILEEL